MPGRRCLAGSCRRAGRWFRAGFLWLSTHLRLMAMVQRKQILAVAAAVAAAVLTLPVGAQAQFFGGGWGFQQPYRPGPPAGGFSFPFFGRPRGHVAPAESYRAPSPRKLETPPSTTVIVVGESMADWLAYGLEEVYADNQQIGVTRNIRQYSGLVHYEPRNETLQWPQAIKDALAAEKPAAIVVMLGLNDRTALRERVAPPKPVQQPQDGKPDSKQDGKSDGKSTPQTASGAEQKPDERRSIRGIRAPSVAYEFRSDQWAQAYKKRIDAMMTTLKSKGVPVLWVGLPRSAVRAPLPISATLTTFIMPKPTSSVSPMWTSGTASSTGTGATRCRDRISRGRPAGCGRATAFISPNTARSSSRISSIRS